MKTMGGGGMKTFINVQSLSLSLLQPFICCFKPSTLHRLNRKFSTGIAGILASTVLNHDFNWKQLSEMIPCKVFF